MANAALTLPRPSSRADASVAPPPGVALTLDRLCAGCGLLALSWVALSLWPGLDAPAWPAASAGLVALALALLPGRVLPKALGTITGFVGLMLGAIQILALWSLAWVGT